jgi:hypothetical protein
MFSKSAFSNHIHNKPYFQTYFSYYLGPLVPFHFSYYNFKIQSKLEGGNSEEQPRWYLSRALSPNLMDRSQSKEAEEKLTPGNPLH